MEIVGVMCEIHGQLIGTNGFFGAKIIMGPGKGWVCQTPISML